MSINVRFTRWQGFYLMYLGLYTLLWGEVVLEVFEEGEE